MPPQRRLRLVAAALPHTPDPRGNRKRLTFFTHRVMLLVLRVQVKYPMMRGHREWWGVQGGLFDP
jgi:hypothetical protein